ncbi:MAG: hypothetical protein AB7U62_11360, partial [Pseudolabrys sp.]
FAMTTNASDANNDIDVASGFARDENNAFDLIMPAGMTKQMDAAWAAGTNAGALLQSANLTGTITVVANTTVTGSGTTFGTDFIVGDVIQTAGGQARRITAIASNTSMTVESAWTSGETGVTYKRGGKARNCVYRVFAIGRDSDGTVDIAVSTRDTPVDLPAGWSGFARIDYQLTDAAGNNRAFVRSGDIRILVTAITLYSESPGGNSDIITTRTTPLPPSVEAYFRITNTTEVYHADLAAPPGAPMSANYRGGIPLNATSSLKTKYQANFSENFALVLYGWRDTRGRGTGGIGANSNAGRVSWPSSITPAALVADTHNWAPTGFAAATVVRLDYAADGRQLTGMTAGAHGDIVELDNIGTAVGILPGESTSSSAANRFAHTDRVYHWPGQTKRFRYDATAQRWRSAEGRSSETINDEAAIASASTADLGAVSTERVLVTGATVIASFGTKTNRRRWVRFQDWVMVTHNATTLALLGGGSRLYMPGDVSLFVSDSSGNWRELAREAANGRVPHIVAQPDPFPTVPFKPRVWANWSTMHWLDDNFTFTRSSTATYLDRAGLLRTAASGVPRFHTIYASGETGLLIEGARTNLFLQSEQFWALPWVVSGASVSGDVAIAPDGSGSADKLVESATNAQHLVGQGVSFSASSTITLSVMAKAAERSSIQLSMWDGANNVLARFNLSTGVIAAAAQITAGTNLSNPVATIATLANGWCLLSLTVATATITSLFCQIDIGNPIAGYLGDGSSGVYLWGAQLEVGAFPSSYIPTTSAQVTRAADVLWRSNADGVLNNLETTLFAEFIMAYRPTSVAGLISVDDGTFNNRSQMFVEPANDKPTGYTMVGGVNQAWYGTASAITYGVAQKVAYAVKQDDFALTLNGGAIATDNSGTVPAATRMTVGADPINPAFVLMKKIAEWPRRITNANLQTVTT